MSVPLSTDQFVTGRPTKRIAVDSLKPTQVYGDSAKIDRLSKIAAKNLPPAVVGAEHVYDGHHRWAGAKKKGAKTIRAVQY